MPTFWNTHRRLVIQLIALSMFLIVSGVVAFALTRPQSTDDRSQASVSAVCRPAKKGDLRVNAKKGLSACDEAVANLGSSGTSIQNVSNATIDTECTTPVGVLKEGLTKVSERCNFGKTTRYSCKVKNGQLVTEEEVIDCAAKQLLCPTGSQEYFNGTKCGCPTSGGSGVIHYFNPNEALPSNCQKVTTEVVTSTAMGGSACNSTNATQPQCESVSGLSCLKDPNTQCWTPIKQTVTGRCLNGATKCDGNITYTCSNSAWKPTAFGCNTPTTAEIATIDGTPPAPVWCYGEAPNCDRKMIVDVNSPCPATYPRRTEDPRCSSPSPTGACVANWGEWSRCNLNCNQYRERTCPAGTSGQTYEKRPCTGGSCPTQPLAPTCLTKTQCEQRGSESCYPDSKNCYQPANGCEQHGVRFEPLQAVCGTGMSPDYPRQVVSIVSQCQLDGTMKSEACTPAQTCSSGKCVNVSTLNRGATLLPNCNQACTNNLGCQCQSECKQDDVAYGQNCGGTATPCSNPSSCVNGKWCNAESELTGVSCSSQQPVACVMATTNQVIAEGRCAPYGDRYDKDKDSILRSTVLNEFNRYKGLRCLQGAFTYDASCVAANDDQYFAQVALDADGSRIDDLVGIGTDGRCYCNNHPGGRGLCVNQSACCGQDLFRNRPENAQLCGPLAGKNECADGTLHGSCRRIGSELQRCQNGSFVAGQPNECTVSCGVIAHGQCTLAEGQPRICNNGLLETPTTGVCAAFNGIIVDAEQAIGPSCDSYADRSVKIPNGQCDKRVELWHICNGATKSYLRDENTDSYCESLQETIAGNTPAADSQPEPSYMEQATQVFNSFLETVNPLNWFGRGGTESTTETTEMVTEPATQPIPISPESVVTQPTDQVGWLTRFVNYLGFNFWSDRNKKPSEETSNQFETTEPFTPDVQEFPKSVTPCKSDAECSGGRCNKDANQCIFASELKGPEQTCEHYYQCVSGVCKAKETENGEFVCGEYYTKPETSACLFDAECSSRSCQNFTCAAAKAAPEATILNVN